jgi:uncharacterized protein (TIGR00299 family) protein
MRLLVIDPYRGAAGDMVTAALVHLGADREAVVRAMSSVVGEPELLMVDRRGIQSLALKTRATAVRRTMEEVTTRVRMAQAPPQAVEMALRVFHRIHRAEKEIHGGSVHFHEVGADDAVAEVIGACTAYCSLASDGCVILPVALGGGTISGAHGTYPAPAPATLAIIRESGLKVVFGTPSDGELCTPTGAALLAEFSTAENTEMADYTITATGYGAGTRDPPHIANVLRAMLVEGPGSGGGGDRVDLLETNVDDVSAEIIAYTSSRLLSEGAYDVCIVPCVMKKGRAGQLIRVVAPSGTGHRLAAVAAAELGSLGIRCIPAVHRFMAERSVRDILVSVGGQECTVPVKIGLLSGKIFTIKAEYDCVAALAEDSGIPARTIARLVEDRAYEIYGRRQT